MNESSSPSNSQEFAAQLEAARERGFRQGMNYFMCALAVIGVVWTIYRIHFDAPKFAEVFKQVKVEMPAITVWILDGSSYLSASLVIAALSSIFMTWRRGDQRSTLLVNLCSFSWSALCLLIVQVALFQPLFSLLEGIGQRH